MFNILSFSNILTNWIMQFISTISIKVIANGRTGQYFQSERGTRQEDPILPYLFILSVEYLEIK